MKKLIAAMMAFAMVICMSGCASKKTVEITISDIGDYEVTEIPTGFESYGKDGNKITVSVKTEGDYKFVLKDESGKEYTVTLTYDNGKVEVSSEDEISVIAGII